VTSTEKNPFHVYSGPGSYAVTLAVQNGNGVNTTAEKDAVVVWGDPPVNASHSVSFATPRGGHIAGGSYLNFNIITLPGRIRLNGTSVDLNAPSNVGLLFNGDGEGEIGIRDRRFENLTYGDLTLFVNGSRVDRGVAEGISVPEISDLSTDFTYFLSPSRGLVSLTWDDRVILKDEDYSAFTLEGLNVDTTGSLSLSVRSNRTSITGNASAYRMPDLTFGGV
jgi:PKD repeat protein